MTEARVFQALLAAWFLMAAASFAALWLVPAPYGRHARPGWGPALPSTLGWILMETPAVIVLPALVLLGPVRPGAASLALVALWMVHYIHRAWVYPFLRRGGQSTMPLSVAAMGAAFNLVNGYLNGRHLGRFSGGYPDDWLVDPRFLGGVGLFVLGLAINRHADRVLRRLRRPGETGYRIPQGSLYRFVSCPNYLGEILEWTGFALAAWSLPALAFAVWTAANLVPRAIANHRWYRRTFPDYPPRRRALVPFVF